MFQDDPYLYVLPKKFVDGSWKYFNPSLGGSIWSPFYPRSYLSVAGEHIARTVAPYAAVAGGIGYGIYKLAEGAVKRSREYHSFTPEKQKRYRAAQAWDKTHDQVVAEINSENLSTDPSTAMPGVTQYHEAKILYRSKGGLSRRRRRAYKNYIINALATQNTQIFKFNNGGVSSSGVDQMGTECIPGLFTLSGNAAGGWNDINLISIETGLPTVDQNMSGFEGTPVWSDKAKMYIKSASIEIDVVNTSATDYVTCYIYYCEGRKHKDVTPNNPFDKLATTNLFYDDPAAATVNALATTDQGISLFDVTRFTSNFIIKGCDKYLLQPSQCFQLNFNAGRRQFDIRDIPISSGTEFCNDQTQFMVILFQGALKNVAGAAQYAAGGISWKCHRTYNVKFLDAFPTTNTVNLGAMNS